MTISFRTIVRGGLAVLGMAALAGQSANAATVSTVFSTGVVANNPITGQPTGTLPGGSIDPHYLLANTGTATASISTGLFGAATAYPVNMFPTSGPYSPPTGGSNYIGPAGAGTPGNGPLGGGAAPQNLFYDFRTTFSLAGFDPTSAILTGRASGDNRITAVYLNGILVNGLSNAAPADFQPATFNFASGFATANTLDFIVFNSANNGNPASNNLLALDVDTLLLTANALPTAVPEPGSVAMLIGMGVTGAGFLSRRKRAAK